jgi:uncharacterized protein (DUF302 family)
MPWQTAVCAPQALRGVGVRAYWPGNSTAENTMTGEPSPAPHSAGVKTLESAHSFPETVAKLKSALESHGIKIFAVIDQQAEAHAAGLEMPPLTLILFGNPKAGTLLMVARPESGLDLPLKAMVWADAAGKIFVSVNAASYVIVRHNLPESLLGNIAPVEGLIANAVK